MGHPARNNILNLLDEQADFVNENFPYLGQGFRHIDGRVSVYGKGSVWAILIEVIEVNPQSIGHDRNLNHVYRYGNRLAQLMHPRKNPFITITQDVPGSHAVFRNYQGVENDSVCPEAQSILVRGHEVPIPRDMSKYHIEVYHNNELNLPEPNGIEPHHLLRALTPEYRDYFFLTDEEKTRMFTQPMPLLLQLEEWHHPLVRDDGTRQMPSESETFQLIADVLAVGDPSQYHPTQPPNTHWSNRLVSDKYL